MSSEQRPQSAEEALELFMEARRRGEPVDPTTFAAQHAYLGAEFSDALSALAALDEAGSDAEFMDLTALSRIGPYRIVRELGRGGMGVVLEAVEEPLGRRVALKILRPEWVASASARGRFRREAELAARLDHSGIATVYGAGVEEERPWIAMRYVDGLALSRAIAKARDQEDSCVRVGERAESGRAALLAVAAMIAKVARALHAAHEQGVVHRDVKPSNIILAPDGTPTLVDFGLAIPEDAEAQTLTRTGETAGTPAYMSPEILSGQGRRCDAQSDVYSLGVTLYEALTLRRPFDGATPFALQHAILAGTTADLRSIHRSAPRDLAIVVATAMERDRTRRYSTAAAFAEDLEACAQGRPIRARPLPLHGRVLRWARREPLQAVLTSLLAVAMIVAAVAAGSWWQGRGVVQAAANMSRNEAFQTALQEGYIYLSVNWFEEADAKFIEVLEMNPFDPEALAGRAIVALKQGQPERVRGITESATSPAFDTLRALADGETPKPRFGPKWFANAPAVEMFVDGWRIMQQMETCAPEEKAALGKLAFERFDEAILRSHVNRMYHHVQRCIAAGESGDEAAIRSAAASLAVLWPSDARANFTAGCALARIAPAEGIPALQRAVRVEPGWPKAHYMLGLQYLATGRALAASFEFQVAAELKPQDADAHVGLGRAWRELGCAHEARAAFLTAASLRPNSAAAWQGLSHAEIGVGDASAALRALQAAVTADPYDPNAHVELGRFLGECGRHDESARAFESCTVLAPERADGWVGWTAVELARGAPDQALAVSEAGLTAAGTNAELLELRGRAVAATEAAAPARENRR
ncbi:MAG: protein kinase [Planctomycetes bacterium]|nr:protein kinase [Planctomycetota bacterium]